MPSEIAANPAAPKFQAKNSKGNVYPAQGKNDGASPAAAADGKIKGKTTKKNYLEGSGWMRNWNFPSVPAWPKPHLMEKPPQGGNPPAKILPSANSCIFTTFLPAPFSC